MRALGLVLLALLLSGSAAHGAPSAGLGATDLGGLSAHQYDVAVHVAREQTDRQHARLTSATARVVPNRHPHAASNTGTPCTSPTVLQILLIGRFPRVTVSPPPGATEEETVVTAMDIRADPATGRACLIGVDTGPQHPPAGSTRLDW